MALAEGGEAIEESGPDADEEGEDEEPDHPWVCVLGGEEVAPVASVRRGEEIVLDDDGDEEPDYDLSAGQRIVEGGDTAGGLAVVGWEAEVEDDSYGP